MPLSLVAVGSALDRARYDVVIVDGRLEPDPGRGPARQIDAGTVCVGVTALTGAPIRDELPVTRAVRAAHPRRCHRVGRLASVVVPRRVPRGSRGHRVRGRTGRVTFPERLDRFAAGAPLDGVPGAATDRRPRGTRASPTGATHRRAETRAGRARRLPVPRLPSPRRRALLRRQGPPPARLHLQPGVPVPLHLLRHSNVYQRGWSGLARRAHGRRAARPSGGRTASTISISRTKRNSRQTAPGSPPCARRFAPRAPFHLGRDHARRSGGPPDDAEWALCKRSGLRRAMVGVESGRRR